MGYEFPVRSVEELNEQGRWFNDPSRTSSENAGPFILVKDEFYHNPHQIRKLALGQNFFSYSPPAKNIVGDDVYSLHAGQAPAWLSSAFLVYKGKPVVRPEPGFRHNPDHLRTDFSRMVREEISATDWRECGDGWNGAFHYMNERWSAENAAIHHHFKSGDIFPRGWAGLIYLSPNAPELAGTSIWRHRTTGRCVADYGSVFEYSYKNSDLEMVFLVENKFNRLVLFRENVLHRAEDGFGQDKHDSRLTQTFFFTSDVAPSGNPFIER